MKLKTLTFNLFYPIWIILSIILAATGNISWWIVIILVLKDIKIEIEKKL